MTVLSAQSIRDLCDPQMKFPLIDPFVERDIINGRTFGLGPCSYDVRSRADVTLMPGASALASTIERFDIPSWLCGTVLDKSSHARLFVTTFNTHLDPGWRGFLTVELVNLGRDVIRWQAGEPLCQVRFDMLDMPTVMRYNGKYQDQPDRPVPAIHEDRPLPSLVDKKPKEK